MKQLKIIGYSVLLGISFLSFGMEYEVVVENNGNLELLRQRPNFKEILYGPGAHSSSYCNFDTLSWDATYCGRVSVGNRYVLIKSTDGFITFTRDSTTSGFKEVVETFKATPWFPVLCDNHRNCFFRKNDTKIKLLQNPGMKKDFSWESSSVAFNKGGTFVIFDTPNGIWFWGPTQVGFPTSVVSGLSQWQEGKKQFYALSPKGTYACVGYSESGQVCVCQVPRGKAVLTIGREEDLVSAAFNGDETLLIAGYKTGEVWIWNVKENGIGSCVVRNLEDLSHVVFGPEEGTFLTASKQGQIVLWEEDSEYTNSAANQSTCSIQ